MSGGSSEAGRRFLPFAEAVAKARSFKLPSFKEWHAWGKGGARPKNLPSNPDKTYKHEGARTSFLRTDSYRTGVVLLIAGQGSHVVTAPVSTASRRHAPIDRPTPLAPATIARTACKKKAFSRTRYWFRVRLPRPILSIVGVGVCGAPFVGQRVSAGRGCWVRPLPPASPHPHTTMLYVPTKTRRGGRGGILFLF